MEGDAPSRKVNGVEREMSKYRSEDFLPVT